MKRRMFLVTVCLLWGVAIAAAADRPPVAQEEPSPPEAAYQAARQQLAAFETDMKKRLLRHHWFKVIDAFRKVEKDFPAHPRAADCLYTLGRLHRELAAISHLPQDREGARAAYQDLVRRFPGHRLEDDARFFLADMDRQRGDTEAARKGLAGLLAACPQGDFVPKARELLAELGGPLPEKTPGQVAKAPVPVARTPAPAAPVVRDEADGPAASPGDLPRTITALTVEDGGRDALHLVFTLAGGGGVLVRPGSAPAGQGKPRRLFADIGPATLGPSLPASRELKSPLAQRVRVGRFDTTTVRVVVDLLTSEAVLEVHQQEQDGHHLLRLTVALPSPTAAASPAVTPEAQHSAEATQPAVATAPDTRPVPEQPRQGTVDRIIDSVASDSQAPTATPGPAPEKTRETPPETPVATPPREPPARPTPEAPAPAQEDTPAARPLEPSVFRPVPAPVEPAPKAAPEPAQKPKAKSSPPVVKPLVIVLDPGHGGKDFGAIGRKGTKEKDIALKIARLTRATLEKSLGRVKVILTRDTDEYLKLKERTTIANEAKADLFISIHCNATLSRKVSGVSTYFLNMASDSYADRLAGRENAEDGGELDDLQFILADLATTATTEESIALARQVQQGMLDELKRRKYTPLKDRGVRSALFFVLLNARMPSILVETSFISNLLEESRLRSAAYQQHMADGIVRGVRAYLKAARTAVGNP